MSGDLEEVTDSLKTLIIDRELNRLNINIAELQETRLAGFGSNKEKNYKFFWQGLNDEEFTGLASPLKTVYSPNWNTQNKAVKGSFQLGSRLPPALQILSAAGTQR